MVNEMVQGVIYWLNKFPMKSGVSQDSSPSNIVEGASPPDFNKDHIPFGLYTMTYIQTKNNMTERSEPSIALRESNELGSHYLMSFKTG